MRSIRLLISAITALTALASPAIHAKSSWSQCLAYTICPNTGRTAACEVYAYGNPQSGGQACTWWVEPYVRVTCTGMAFDEALGTWVWATLVDSCY